MKINETRSVGGTGAVRSRMNRTYGVQGQSATSEPRDISDSAAVLGIPEAELTPKVRSAIMTLMEEVARLRQDLAQTERRLTDVEQLADQDGLVPLVNRRAFVRELTRVASYSERYNTPASLIYFDVNQFKIINDTHGHAAGDAALQAIAETLASQVRESDIVGRIGGDEFAVILERAGEDVAQRKALSLAETIRQRPLKWQQQNIALDVAFGVYAFRPGVDVDQAMAEADRAMYANKQTTVHDGD